MCPTCQVPETMEHILTECRERARTIIWDIARHAWPYNAQQWPEISIGILLGGGCIALPNPPRPDQNHGTRNPRQRGKTRLLQILITESAYLIWVLRCERTIQEKVHNDEEIKRRWLRVINKRLTDDKIIATRIKKTKKSLHQVRDTWEDVLSKQGDIPNMWIYNREVLVGMRT